MTIIVQVKVNIDIHWTWFGQSIQENCQVHTLNSFFCSREKLYIREYTSNHHRETLNKS